LLAGIGRRKCIEGDYPVEQLIAPELHDFRVKSGKLLSTTQFRF
jgi:hypothetical protein